MTPDENIPPFDWVPDDHDPYAEIKPHATQGPGRETLPEGVVIEFRDKDNQVPGALERTPIDQPSEPGPGWTEAPGSLGHREAQDHQFGRSYFAGTPDALAPLPTDLEIKLNIDSLDLLQHKRRLLCERLKGLEYLFGSGGDRCSAVRRQHRDGIYRLLMTETKETADGKLEKLANSDPRHVTFCEHLERQFTDYYMLKLERDEIDERIRNREIEMRVWIAEAGLAR